MNMYRFTDTMYAAMLDENERSFCGGRSGILLHIFPVLSETPKGKWVYAPGEGRRFILNASRKRFAHETKELALKGFIARKRRQASILRAQLAHVDAVLREALA